MRGIWFAVSFILAAFALSGCVGGSSKSSETAGPAEAPPTARPAEISDETGGVEGTVLDPELVPVAGAQVAIAELNVETVSAQDGRFSFSQVAPGTYTLFALKLGYESAAKKIPVVAGEVTPVQVTIAPLPITEPYSVLMSAKGVLGCAVDIDGIIGVAACGLPVVNSTVGDRFLILWDLREPTPPWNGSVFETHWKSNQILGQGLNPIWEVEPCYNDNDVTFAEGGGRSPVIFRVDEDKTKLVLKNLRENRGCNAGKNNCNEEKCLVVSRMFTEAETTGTFPDVGFTIQQTYENFFTAFFFEPAPEDYTAKPDT